MIGRFFSAPVLSLLFGVGYAFAVYVNVPLFRYYPLVNRFSLTDLATASLGPAMAWYGWIATGLVFALVVTPFVPRRIGDKLPAPVFWLVVAAMFVAAGYRERDWFMAAP